jgi:hypothetical protein
MTDRTAIGIWLLGALAAGLLLQSCREEEQNRPLLYEKGSYLGEPGPPLEEQQVEQLRYRARNQQF